MSTVHLKGKFWEDMVRLNFLFAISVPRISNELN